MGDASLSRHACQTPQATDLIARARDDLAAFGELYRQYYGLVFRYCHRRVLVRDTAEDLTGEVFLRMAEKFDGFRGDQRALRGWLYRLATNCVNEHLRKRARRRVIDEALLRERRAASPADGEPPADIADEALDLKRALLRLSLRQQTLVALRYFEDMTHAEISAVLGGSPATIRSQISRALARLHKMLAGGSYGEHGKT
jgi:RNA polymerase sigma-70 factor (ECF subfamily)